MLHNRINNYRIMNWELCRKIYGSTNPLLEFYHFLPNRTVPMEEQAFSLISCYEEVL